MSARDLLFELGTEELPTNLLHLQHELQRTFEAALKESRLDFQSSRVYASPRRLAIKIAGLSETQPDRHIERQGPKVDIAFDNEGRPTKACDGFARSLGTTPENLATTEIKGEQRLYYSYTEPGQPTEQLLQGIIDKAINDLILPKSMRWGSYDKPFVRPVHWVVCLYGSQVVPVALFHHQATNLTYGHRFHHPQAIELVSPSDYESKLRHPGMVIADFSERKQAIRQQTEQCLTDGEQPVFNNELLDEVTALVEWPVALSAHFDRRFLELPPEVIISAIQEHQKSFPVRDDNGELNGRFITIANIDSAKPNQVAHGNERVVRARLADAEFFYDTDKLKPLIDRVEALKNVVFHHKLGTLYDKTRRIVHNMRELGQQLDLDSQQAERAGWLAKTDLLTEMVEEFTELQGLMGYYYALANGEPQAVANALAEHYRPRFAHDEVPTSSLGIALSLADKMDNLAAMFSIYHYPTGEKDPFALRRAAIGILRIIVEHGLELDLKTLIDMAADAFDKVDNPNTQTELLEFIMDRFRAWYQEQNISSEIFQAVYARYPTRPYDFHQRVLAVQNFQQLPEAASLAEANKRVYNLLKKAPSEVPDNYDIELAEVTHERELAQALRQQKQQVDSMYERSQYTEALRSLADLKAPVDAFFDHVYVMCDDKRLKLNRLALLKELRALFTYVADISYL